MNLWKQVWGWMSRLPVPVHSPNKRSVTYLREEIFRVLALSIIYLGVIIVALSTYASLKAKVVDVLVFDIIFYVILVFAVVNRKFSYVLRVAVVLSSFYLIGLFMLLMLGPVGTGWIWLFAFSCMASLLLPIKFAILTIALNLVTLLILGLLLALDIHVSIYFNMYNLPGWLANMANFAGLNVFVGMSFALLVRSVERNMDHLNLVRRILRENRDKLLQLNARAEESDRLKSLFLANMSHEIRSPMNAILGFTELLRRQTTVNDKTDVYLGIIQDRGKVLLKLINDLLDISRIEANELKLVPEMTEVEPLVKKVWSTYKENPEYASGKVEFKLIVPPYKVPPVTADPFRLQQVITNLVHNAFKFTQKGFIQLGYHATGQEVLFFVQDTGSGIPAVKLNSVFDRFYQTEKQHQQSGAGLGLAISKALVEKMGGRIWAESEEEAGSTFFFTLPATLTVSGQN